MNDNRWERYELLVLETLERLEGRIDDLDNAVRQHMREEETERAQMRQELAQLRSDAAWRVKIVAGSVSAVVTVGGLVLQFLLK